VREWRDEYYRAYRGEQETPDSTEQGSEEKQTQNEFLMQYDLAYRIRRLDFVLNRIDRLYGLDQQAARTLEDLNIKPIPREEAEKQRFRTELWRSIFKPRKVSWVLREEEVMPGGHIGLTPSRRYGSLTVVRVHQYKISLSKVARCANGGRYPAAGVCGGAYLRA
jgi:hypothetical protein